MSDMDENLQKVDALVKHAESRLGYQRSSHFENQRFPWSGVVEDRYLAELAISKIYDAMGLKTPKFAWAASPRSMEGAIEMLRTVHRGTRQEMVRSLVPSGNPVETEAKRVLLEAMLDRDLTVTTGAFLADKVAGRGSIQDSLIARLARLVPSLCTLNIVGAPRLAEQALFIAPYVHLCWLSRPPVLLQDAEPGEAPLARFADGFEVYEPRGEFREETLALEAGTEPVTKVL